MPDVVAFLKPLRFVTLPSRAWHQVQSPWKHWGLQPTGFDDAGPTYLRLDHITEDTTVYATGTYNNIYIWLYGHIYGPKIPKEYHLHIICFKL